MGHVGIVLGLEVSRLARNNGDWYRLLDLCGMTDTLIGDADGVYHPGLFNDRLLLGLKGTMSEAEPHILRAWLDGGIRNKVACGGLRRGVARWIRLGRRGRRGAFQSRHRRWLQPSARCSNASPNWVRCVGSGSGSMPKARLPHQSNPTGEARWSLPTYIAIHHVLTNPVYAGAYCYGKTRNERYIDEQGQARNASAISRSRSGLFSFPGTMKAISTGPLTKPSRQGSTATPTRDPTRRAARCAKGVHCCKASPSAATADGACGPTIVDGTPPPATIARAKTSSAGGVSTASTSAVCKSTGR